MPAVTRKFVSGTLVELSSIGLFKVDRGKLAYKVRKALIMQKPIPYTRRHRGSLIAELPIALYLLIFGFAIPAIGMATIGCRIALIWVVARNAVNTASKASSYTLAAASASAAQSRGSAAFPFIQGTGTLQIISYPVSVTAAPTVYPPGVIAANLINTSTNTYYLRWTVNGVVDPLITDTGWLGTAVPGLTGPINIKVLAESYVENPNGLQN